MNRASTVIRWGVIMINFLIMKSAYCFLNLKIITLYYYNIHKLYISLIKYSFVIALIQFSGYGLGLKKMSSGHMVTYCILREGYDLKS